MLDNDDTTNDPSNDASNDPGNDRDQSSNVPAGTPPAGDSPEADAAPAVKKAAAKKTAAKKPAAKKATKTATKEPAAKKATKAAEAPADGPERPKKKAASRKKAAAPQDESTDEGESQQEESDAVAPMVLFKAPEKKTAPPRKKTAKKTAPDDGDDQLEQDDKPGKQSSKGSTANRGDSSDDATPDDPNTVADEPDEQDDSGESGDGEGGARRRRRRGGRRRRRPSDGNGEDSGDSDDSEDEAEESGDSDGPDGTGASRRRRRRRRSGDDSGGSGDDSDNTVTRARKQRKPEDEITSIGGSTRLEAKKQRRREGREAGRRRAPIVSEAEFLARRESVDRVMVIRQKDDLTQIGVLEDKVLVEHYVARESQTSLIGNVYLGRVQNVLPSMEAAFIDIGKGRNAVIYAGEVNWAAVGHKDGQPRKIESVLSSGQTVLVQVTKDPVGHKGARLTGQVSLPGRFLVYVPEGNTSGISRKLPDTERNRLKTLLKEIVPESAGVIVRTAAEGASEDELTRDVERLTALWNDIEEKVKAGKSPQLLYGEPDLTLKVVRDLFTEDFAKLVVQGEDAWDLVHGYVTHVAPDLADRLERFEPAEEGKHEGLDLFATYRLDEQIAKGLDRKVWLPSGGSLVIDRTEAMTVVDVNTGKFTGSGGNLEETVTKNNLEAAEEIVRQLRLRDIGGIIVVDFIDMVLESNRDLVLRRLVECLGRDRTRHQVAEVTSLGLVQMTRKRIGTGLLEAFSQDCEHCKGRGVVVHDHPVEASSKSDDGEPRGRRSRGGRNRGGRGSASGGGNGGGAHAAPSPADLAHSRPPEKPAPEEEPDDQSTEQQSDPQVESVVGTPSPIPPEPQEVPSSEDDTQQDPGHAETTPEPPRVVTSTRRRTARRPAGPPPEASPAEPPVAGEPTSTAEPLAPPDPRVEQADEADQADQGPEHPDPTWPEDTANEPGDEPDSGSDHGHDAGHDEGHHENPGGGFSLTHVPIKRKGSRKR